MDNLYQSRHKQSHMRKKLYIPLPNDAAIYDVQSFAISFAQLYTQYIAHVHQKNIHNAYVVHIPNTIDNYCITLPLFFAQQCIKKHIYIIVQQDAQVMIDQVLFGKQDVTMRCFLEPYAQLMFVQKNKHAQHSVSSIYVEQQEHSKSRLHGWYETTMQVNIVAQLRDIYASADIRIGCLAKKSEIIKAQTTQKHYASYTQSSATVKGLVRNRSVGSHHGTIYISPEVASIVADQQSNYMLMDETAQAYTQPNLEVLSHDVQCSHGSAIGRFDDEQLFYMLSRGIAQEGAIKLLQDAFFETVLF